MPIESTSKYLNRFCPIIPSSIDEAIYHATKAYGSFGESIHKLQEHDSSVLSFQEANRFVAAYDQTVSNSIDISGRVAAYKEMREEFLLKVLQFGEIYFASKEGWYEDLKDLSEESVRIIDPALIGRKRYQETDYYVVQIFKIVYYSLNCFYHKCRNGKKVNQIVSRYELLAWADTYASFDEIFVSEKSTPIKLRKHNETTIVIPPVIQPFKKHPLVQELLIQGLGINDKEEEEKEIQEIFSKICPLNKVKSHTIKSDGTFKIILDKARAASVQIPEFYLKEVENLLKKPKIKEGLEKIGTEVIFSNELMSLKGLASIFANQVKLKVAEVITGKIVREEGKLLKVVFNKNMIYLELPFALSVPNILGAIAKSGGAIQSNPVLDTILSALSTLGNKTLYAYLEIQELARGTNLSDVIIDGEVDQRILKRTLGVGFHIYGGMVWNWILELAKKLIKFSLEIGADSHNNESLYVVLDALKWDR